MTSRPATVRLSERPDRGVAKARDIIGHLNLARGFRGGERQTELLVQGLSEWGLHQRVIARAGEALALRTRALKGVEAREVAGGLLSAANACRGCSVVHVHDGRSVHAAALARALWRVPYIITRRVDNPIRKHFWTRRAYRKAAFIAGVSRAVCTQVQALDKTLQCAVVADAASAYPHHEQMVKKLREKYAGRYVVGHVGALDHSHKGQRDIFAAAQALHLTHPDIVFVLLGGGRDEADFKAATATMKNVDLVGHVDNVGDYLAAFDAFVFPSLHEGLGSALLDAMDYKLPIVATRVGGIVELIKDDVNGLLVQPGNTDQLGYAIARLHDNPALAQRLAAAGHAKVQAYAPAKMVDRYLEIYQPMIGTAAVLDKL